ncbi:MAG: hypothetical protein ACJ75J_17960, partial [Cytophagaceae bacterium]
QIAQVQIINLNRAEEIQRAKKECGDDVTGFNEYVDKVSFARDQELKSVLTSQQFAAYTAKSGNTWLGMEKFKFKSDDDQLKVKENRHELKIKGKATVASEDLSASNREQRKNEYSDANSNPNNIQPETSHAEPDFHNIPKDDATPLGDEAQNMGSPERKTYPGEMQNGDAYGISSSKTGVKKTDSKKAVTGSAKAAAKKSGSVNKVAKSSSAGAKQLNAGTKSKTVKPSAKAATKKKPVGASANTKKPVTAKKPVNSSGTDNADEYHFSSGQTLRPAPDSDDFYDTDASAKASKPDETNASPAQENFFINEDSKAKISEDEIKIKPEKGVKYKITDDESKFKDKDAKLKVTEDELKAKDKDEKLKVTDKETKDKFSDGTKVKSNDHETKVKSKDLKIKIKE